MNSRRTRGFAVAFGAAAGAVLGAGLVSNAVAQADDMATLPVPPFDRPDGGSFYHPPGIGGDWTNVEDSKYPPYEVQYDQAYTLPDGDYEIHGVAPHPDFPEQWFYYASEQVTSSNGVAPAVGTEWNYESFQIPFLGSDYAVFQNISMTTPAGMVDAFTWEQPLWFNDFYYGPTGIFDYLIHNVGLPSETVIPIIYIPAEMSPAGAADFSTLWSDLLGTL